MSAVTEPTGFNAYDLLATILPGTILLLALTVLFWSTDVVSLESIPTSQLQLGNAVLLVIGLFLLGEFATLFSGSWDPGRFLFAHLSTQIREGRSEPATQSRWQSWLGESILVRDSPRAPGDGPYLSYPLLIGFAFTTFDRITRSTLLEATIIGRFVLWLVDTFRELTWPGRILLLIGVAVPMIVLVLLVALLLPILGFGYVLPYLVQRLVLFLLPKFRTELVITSSLKEFVRTGRSHHARPSPNSIFRRIYTIYEPKMSAQAQRLRLRSVFYHHLWATFRLVLVLYAVAIEVKFIRFLWADIYGFAIPTSLAAIHVSPFPVLLGLLVLIGSLQGYIGLQWWRTEYEYVSYLAEGYLTDEISRRWRAS